MNYVKKIKKQIIEESSKNPEKYFPVKILKKINFQREKCSGCGIMFWAKNKREFCGDGSCCGGYSFIDYKKNVNSKIDLSLSDIYLKFKDFMKKKDYHHFDRFPIVARWRDDLDFNIASIIGFQPYITKGIIEPENRLLTIPQNCLRFNDIENVGFTARHLSSFTMIGQLAFFKEKDFNQEKYFLDLFEFFTKEMKFNIDEIQIHEDAWAGGGDCGPSLEFFSKGLEIANQVYMLFDMSKAKDIKELKNLKIKVLDMGMGAERLCWIKNQSLNTYDCVMNKTCKFLFSKIKNVDFDFETYKKFLPYSGNLNLDEFENIEEEWDKISKKIRIDKDKLKEKIQKIAQIYFIADHSRSLLYAMCDGALPSNVKGGYNLRLILRRCFDVIKNNSYDINIYDLMVLHSVELKELYPELNEIILNSKIKDIIEKEKEKYENHKIKSKEKIKSLLNKKIEKEDFIKFYISDGITPNEIEDYFLSQNKKISIPSNFYNLVIEYFENQKNNQKKEEKEDLKNLIEGVEDTKLLYYDDMEKTIFDDAKIIKEINYKNKKYLILDKTIFFPEGGGQASDFGIIDNKKIINVIKIDNIVLHEVGG